MASRAVDCGPFDYNLAEGDDGENIEIMKKTMIRVKKRLRMMRGSDQVDFRRISLSNLISEFLPIQVQLCGS